MSHYRGNVGLDLSVVAELTGRPKSGLMFLLHMCAFIMPDLKMTCELTVHSRTAWVLEAPQGPEHSVSTHTIKA